MGNNVVFTGPKEKNVPKWMESRLYYYKKGQEEEKTESNTNVSLTCWGDRRPSQKRIPYLWFKEETEPNKSQYLMIYFHGSGSVLSKSYITLERYHSIFKISMLSAEYAGYGLYHAEPACEETIIEDAELIIRYCINTLNYKEENIILLGRSLGTGVAARMGSIFPNLKGIILISPYLSIRDVARYKTGMIVSKLVPDIFKTKDIIEQVKSPILFIHGLKDTLIPATSSTYLHDRCKSSIKMLSFSPTMEHKKMDFQPDICIPILKFFVEKLQIIEFQEQYNKEKTIEISSQKNLEYINLENTKTDDLSSGLLGAKDKSKKLDPIELE